MTDRRKFTVLFFFFIISKILEFSWYIKRRNGKKDRSNKGKNEENKRKKFKENEKKEKK